MPPGSPGGSFGVPGHSSGGSLGVMGGAAAASSLLAGYVDGGSLARTSSMRTSSRDQPAVDGSSLARSSLLYSADGGSGLARTSLRASSREQPAVYHGEMEEQFRQQQQQQAGSTSSDVKMMEIIGRGGFGSVYKAFWRGKICAVKVRARMQCRPLRTAERGGRGGCLSGHDGPAGSCAVGGEETSSSSP